MSNTKAVWSDYLPFRGLSAWFSSSVKPAVSKKWDQHGGSFSGETEADFLFSDNTFSVDTVRVYNTQSCVTVFQSTWVSEVVSKRCSVHDVPLGQHILLPHYLVQVCVNGDPFKTPETSTLMKQYRGAESPATAAANTTLSQMLARREEAKAGSREGERGGGLSGGGELRNSRECFSQSPSFKTSFKTSAGDSGALERGKIPVKEVTQPLNSSSDHGAEGAGPELTTAASAAASSDMCRGGTGGGSDGAWGELNHVMQTTSLKDMLHIDSVSVAVAGRELVDFDPQLPEFTMKRK